VADVSVLLFVYAGQTFLVPLQATKVSANRTKKNKAMKILLIITVNLWYKISKKRMEKKLTLIF
jgi:hypothetical protein